jgi:hypothetical protein
MTMFSREPGADRAWPLFPPAWQGVVGAAISLVAALAGFIGVLPGEARWLVLLSLWSLLSALVVRRRRGTWTR